MRVLVHEKKELLNEADVEVRLLVWAIAHSYPLLDCQLVSELGRWRMYCCYNIIVVVVLVMSSGNTMNTNTSPAVRGQLPNNTQQQPRLPGQFTNTAILANL